MSEHHAIYRILFLQQDKVYEIFSRYLSEESLMGFIEIEELIFEEDKTIVDPAEERVRKEFAGVQRSYIPLHAILRIDEVEKQGTAKVRKLKTVSQDNIRPFPDKK